MKKELRAIQKRKLPRKEIEVRVKNALLQIFSENQVSIILKKQKRVNWSSEDLSVAFTLRYFSKRSYLYLKRNLHFPLPGISTLQHWASKIKIGNGLLTDVIAFMKIAALGKKVYEKVAVLMFDEVKVKGVYEYNQMTDEVVGPHSQMQVVMIRGLFSNWKQPIFIDFDTQMTSATLTNIISNVEENGYDVRAIVCDMGGGNQGLWKELGISIKRPWFSLGGQKKRIHAFADTPHLLKLTRNWLLDKGFDLGGGEIVNADPLKALIAQDNGELKVCHKLSALHVECEGARRQNVRLAAELLSHTTATALKTFKPGFDADLATRTGEFIEVVNKWFDIMNSYIPNLGTDVGKCGYGLRKEDQDRALNEMYNLMESMRCIKKRALQVFQKGIMIGIKSIKGLFEDVQAIYKSRYILTHRVNQDALENLFSQLRTRGGLNDHPTALNALYRLRTVILGKNPGIVQVNANTESQTPDEYLLSSLFKKTGVNIMDSIMECELIDDGEEYRIFDEVNAPIPNDGEQQSSQMEDDGLLYVAGWLAKKFKKTHNLGDYTYKLKIDHSYTNTTWIQQLSYGGLIQPNENFMGLINQWNSMFLNHHGSLLMKGTGLMQTLSNKIHALFPTVDKKIIIAFVRIRTFIRMKTLNKEIEIAASQKARKRVAMTDVSDAQRKKNNKIRKIVT